MTRPRSPDPKVSVNPVEVADLSLTGVIGLRIGNDEPQVGVLVTLTGPGGRHHRTTTTEFVIGLDEADDFALRLHQMAEAMRLATRGVDLGAVVSELRSPREEGQ